MNIQELAIGIYKHPLIQEILKRNLAPSSLVNRLIVEELMAEDDLGEARTSPSQILGNGAIRRKFNNLQKAGDEDALFQWLTTLKANVEKGTTGHPSFEKSDDEGARKLALGYVRDKLLGREAVQQFLDTRAKKTEKPTISVTDIGAGDSFEYTSKKGTESAVQVVDPENEHGATIAQKIDPASCEPTSKKKFASKPETFAAAVGDPIDKCSVPAEEPEETPSGEIPEELAKWWTSMGKFGFHRTLEDVASAYIELSRALQEVVVGGYDNPGVKKAFAIAEKSGLNIDILKQALQKVGRAAENEFFEIIGGNPKETSAYLKWKSGASSEPSAPEEPTPAPEEEPTAEPEPTPEEEPTAEPEPTPEPEEEPTPEPEAPGDKEPLKDQLQEGVWETFIEAKKAFIDRFLRVSFLDAQQKLLVSLLKNLDDLLSDREASFSTRTDEPSAETVEEAVDAPIDKALRKKLRNDLRYIEGKIQSVSKALGSFLGADGAATKRSGGDVKAKIVEDLKNLQKAIALTYKDLSKIRLPLPEAAEPKSREDIVDEVESVYDVVAGRLNDLETIIEKGADATQAQGVINQIKDRLGTIKQYFPETAKFTPTATKGSREALNDFVEVINKFRSEEVLPVYAMLADEDLNPARIESIKQALVVLANQMKALLGIDSEISDEEAVDPDEPSFVDPEEVADAEEEEVADGDPEDEEEEVADGDPEPEEEEEVEISDPKEVSRRVKKLFPFSEFQSIVGEDATRSMYDAFLTVYVLANGKQFDPETSVRSEAKNTPSRIAAKLHASVFTDPIEKGTLEEIIKFIERDSKKSGTPGVWDYLKKLFSITNTATLKRVKDALDAALEGKVRFVDWKEEDVRDLNFATLILEEQLYQKLLPIIEELIR